MVYSGINDISRVPQTREFLLLLINLHLLRIQTQMYIYRYVGKDFTLMNELSDLLVIVLSGEQFVILVRTKTQMDKFAPL